MKKSASDRVVEILKQSDKEIESEKKHAKRMIIFAAEMIVMSFFLLVLYSIFPESGHALILFMAITLFTMGIVKGQKGADLLFD